MNRATALVVSSFLVVVVAGCSAADGTPDEDTEETSAAATLASGSVPKSVLKKYAFWSTTDGTKIDQEPGPRSGCKSPLDAVSYQRMGCLDANGKTVSIPRSELSGTSCSAGDGSGITDLQSQCLGGWLFAIKSINSTKIPSNVVLTGVNKVAASVTRVILLECPTPPSGLSEHNVIYKAVYNNGVFASKTPDGCTPYELQAK